MRILLLIPSIYFTMKALTSVFNLIKVTIFYFVFLMTLFLFSIFSISPLHDSGVSIFSLNKYSKYSLVPPK